MNENILLDISNLRIEVEQTNFNIVEAFDLRVNAGEVVALVGESGSGKTMAARSILGLLPAGLCQTDGKIMFLGNDISTMSPKQLQKNRGSEIGMVFQEPMVSLNPAMTVGAQLHEGLTLHTDLSPQEREDEIVAMLERVHIADAKKCMKSYPHVFSGGMRQRIMLASVMLLKPKLLIADEPTTALDTITQKEVLDLMVELTRDHDTAVLLITHNLGLVARYAERVVVMQSGVKREEGSTQEILSRPSHDYTKSLVNAVAYKNNDIEQASDKLVVELKDFCVSYKQPMRLIFRTPPKKVLKNINLKIHAGETLAVVGGSGSGKTTLGRAMLKLLPAASGQLLFDGQDVSHQTKLNDFRLACQLIFQDPFSSLNPRMQVVDIVREPLRHMPELSVQEKTNLTREILENVGLGNLGSRFPHELSGGQRQRVAIARALVRKPKFIVADEPVSALDMTIQKQVVELLKDLQKKYGFACLMISHDLATVQEIAHRTIVMQEGEIVEQGETNSLFSSPQHEYTRLLIEASPETDLHKFLTGSNSSVFGVGEAENG